MGLYFGVCHLRGSRWVTWSCVSDYTLQAMRKLFISGIFIYNILILKEM